PALVLHLGSELPCPAYDLGDAAHSLAVRSEHGDRTQVMEDIFGGDGLSADAAFGKGDVLGYGGIEVMAHHGHVEMLIECVHGIRIGGVGGGGKAVHLTRNANDVGRMSASCPFGVIHMNGAPPDRGERVFEKAAFIERIGVQLDLKIEL